MATEQQQQQQQQQQPCSSTSPALSFEVLATSGRARASLLTLPHGSIRTPVFMPVGTKGSIKGLSSEQLTSEEAMDPEIILGNTYHLALQPGTDVVQHMGGLHTFMNWKHCLLTDSGGFQMVSLLKLAEITEEGVKFRSPIDDSEMMLTPEQSIKCQNEIGADIIMRLDDVVSSVCVDEARFQEATDRSVRWLDRCIAAHARPHEQSLFGIIQGGLDVSPNGMRERCLQAMIARDLPGYAIGGLAGGEDKDSFWRVVAHNAARLPSNKPRYLMGVGYPLDLVVCVALGVDMFDCVYPTRTARFGVAFLDTGTIRLKAKEFNGHSKTHTHTQPVDPLCVCSCCKHYSRAAIHVMLKENNSLAAQLLTVHNIAYMMRLMRTMRTAIINGEFQPFVCNFLRTFFGPPSSSSSTSTAAASSSSSSSSSATTTTTTTTTTAAATGAAAEGRIPLWVSEAMREAGVDISQVETELGVAMGKVSGGGGGRGGEEED